MKELSIEKVLFKLILKAGIRVGTILFDEWGEFKERKEDSQ